MTYLTASFCPGLSFIDYYLPLKDHYLSVEKGRCLNRYIYPNGYDIASLSLSIYVEQ
jgi:hypothetical protein